MPSVLAQRIISTWERVCQERNMEIPQCNTFESLKWGVMIDAREKSFVQSGERICPLGAILLGHCDEWNSFTRALVDILQLDNVAWIDGFLSARFGEKPQINRRHRRITPVFEAGWNVALEVLEWTHNRLQK